MTTGPGVFGEPAPALESVAEIRTTAGQPVVVRLTVTNTAAEPRVFSVTALGVDAQWLPRPSRSRAVDPGESITADMTLRPTEGTISARYPLAIAVEAIDPTTDAVMAATGYRQIDLVVDAPGQIDVELDPRDTTAVFGRKIRVILSNTGSAAADVRLEPRASSSVHVSLDALTTNVPAGQSVSVAGRLKLAKPSLVQWRGRHTYLITARSTGAPKYAEGAIKARPFFGSGLVKVLTVLVVIALWAGLAAVFIPKLSDSLKKRATADSTKTTSSTAPATPGKSGGASGGSDGPNGSGGSGGSGGGSGSGGSGSGGSGGASPAGAAAAAKAIQLVGTVTGASPGGVKVTLASSSIGDAAAQGAKEPGATTQSGPVGKLTAASVDQAATSNVGTTKSMTTKVDGAWAFSKVKASGYYLLSFSKAGYQTVKFVIDPTSATATQPLKVDLLPGQGSLSGTVNAATGGVVPGAKITITDGTDTVTTSSNSRGATGHWAVNGLSTPGTFLVSISANHLSTESKLVTLNAGENATVDLTLKSGVATLHGKVLGSNGDGLGGVQVVATAGKVVRSATTLTAAGGTLGSSANSAGQSTGLIGTYTIPDLPPGKYTVTISAPGYETQSHIVTVAAGDSQIRLGASLQSAMAIVSGQVLLRDKTTGAYLPRSDAGVTLSNESNTYKLTSADQTKDNPAGLFSFDDVVPGTYTLTASYFNTTTAYLTVLATVGHELKHRLLKLKTLSDSGTSTIGGYVGNAVSSGGTLCAKDTTCSVRLALSQFDDGTIKQGVPPSKDPDLGQWVPVQTAVNGSKTFSLRPTLKASGTGPTPYILAAKGGLNAGLYQLGVISTGFLTAFTTVRVTFNSIAAAPPVNLFPANKLAGTVSSAVSTAAAPVQINSDTGFTGAESCVWAVPLNDTEVPTDCPQTAPTTDPTTGATIVPQPVEPDQNPCILQGLETAKLALVQANGAYSMTNLCDGQYKTYTVVTNPAYDNPTKTDADNGVPAFQVTVSHGETASYNKVVNRLAKLVLSAQYVDPTAGGAGLRTVASTSVDVSCDSRPKQTIVLDSTGTGTAYVAPFSTTKCIVTPTNPSDSTIGGLQGTFGGQSLNYNQTTPASVVLSTAQTGWLFGHVQTTWGDGSLHDLPGEPVDVSGVTGYDGGAAVTSHTSVTTNTLGCFAVSLDAVTTGTTLHAPADSDVPSGCRDTSPGATAAFTDDEVATLSLLTAQATVDINADTYTEGVQKTLELTPATTADPTLVPGLNAAALSTSGAPPLPALTLKTDPATSNPGGATVTVSPQPTGGAISVTVGSDGKLDWFDSRTGDHNRAYPGIYELTVNLPGFAADQTVEVDCLPTPSVAPRAPAKVCTIPPGHETLEALGSLSGTVQSKADDSASNQLPISGATVVLVRCGNSDDAACDATAPAVTASSDPCPITGIKTTTDSFGNFAITGPSSQYCLRSGFWRAYVTAPGYVPFHKDVKVGSGNLVLVSNEVGASAVSLSALGSIRSVVVANVDGSNVPLGGATVSATCLTGCTSDATDACPNPPSATTSPDGSFTIDNGSGKFCLPPGTWSVLVTATGYQPSTTITTVTSGVKTLPNIQPVALGALNATLYASGAGLDNHPVQIGNVTLTWCGTVTVNLNTGADNPAPTQCDAAHPPTPATPPTPGLCVSNATVSDTITRTTTANGTFTVTGTNPPYCMALGWYKIGVDATGFGTTASADPNCAKPGGTTGVNCGYMKIVSGTQTANLFVTAQGGLSGTVYGTTADDLANNRLGATLPNASLTLTASNGTQYTTTSNNDGTYTFSKQGSSFFLTSGDYGLQVTADGYQDYLNSTVTISSGSTALNPSLKAKGAVTGTVTGLADAGNTGAGPVSGATVTLVWCGVDGASCPVPASPVTTVSSPKCSTGGISATANSDGGFTVSSPTASRFCLATGFWRVRASAPGYVSTADTVDPIEVKSGDNSIDLKLDLQAGFRGSISGSANGVSTGTLGSATVKLTFCGAVTIDTPTTCDTLPTTPTVVTATANGGGTFDFGNGTTAYTRTVGEYLVSESANGYQTSDPTPIFLGRGQNSQDFVLSSLGNLSGTIYGTNDTASPTPVPLSGATVTLKFSTSTETQVTTTASDGTYTFATANVLYPLRLGKWQVTVSATGYQTTTDPSLVTVGTGNNTGQNESIVRKVKLTGKVTGTVGNNTSQFTQAISGATVTATFCGDPGTSPTCPADSDPAKITLTATSDLNGNYSFATSATPYTLQHGYWRLSTTAFGYTDKVGTPVLLQALAADATQDVSMTVIAVTQGIAVQISSGADTINTSHVTVTLARADGVGSPVTLVSTPTSTATWDSVGKRFLAAGLAPTTYSYQIKGDSTAIGSTVLQTNGTLIVPLIKDLGDTVPDAKLSVPLIQNNITGTIVGAGQSGTDPLANVVVELGTVDGSGNFQLGQNAAEHDMTTTTSNTGAFTIAGIPNGTYRLRVNKPPSAADVVYGYPGQILPSPVIVQYGTVSYNGSPTVGTITLAPQTQSVSYTINTAAGDDVHSATVKLKNVADPTWILSPTSSPTGSTAPFTWSWPNVTFGCWEVTVKLPTADHFGSPTYTTTTTSTADSNLSCSSGDKDVTVSGSSTATASTTVQTLAEHELDLSVTLTKVDANSPLPTPVTVEVKGAVGSGIDPTFSSFATDGSATKIWLPDGTYSLTASAGGHTSLWTNGAATATFSTGSGAASQGSLTMAEDKLGEVDVATFTHAGFTAPSAAHPLTVTLVCRFPDGTNTEPNACATPGARTGGGATPVTDTGGATNKFPKLQTGNWYVEVTGSLLNTASPAVLTPVDFYQAVTVTKGGTVTTTNGATDWKVGPIPS